MDRELQEYYENRFDMMATPGWIQLAEDAQRMRDAYNRVDGLGDSSPEYRLGQLDILDWMLTLRKVSEESYRILEEEDADL